MFLAIGLFVGVFLTSLALTRTAPWNAAFYQSIPFPQIEPDVVQRKVRGRTLRRPWFAVALAGSALTAVAAILPAPLMLVPMFAGIILIVAFAFVRGFILFKTGVAELGIEWPPKKGIS
jgi:hypothetical protein